MKIQHVIANRPLEKRRCCPWHWDEWLETGNAAVRNCPNCGTTATLCEDDAEAVRLGRGGHTIAVPWVPYELVEKIERKVPAKPDVTPAELKIIKASSITRTKADALGSVATAERFCSQCGYPRPSWWKTCKVCDAIADDHAGLCKEIARQRKTAKRKRDKSKVFNMEEALTPLLRDTWILNPVQPGKTVERIMSKLGGAPYLEDGEEWPSCKSCSKPLGFVAQVNLAGLPLEDELGFALFSFYYCWDCNPYGYLTKQDEWAVRTYETVDPRRLSTADPPAWPYDLLSEPRECALRFKKAPALPDWEDLCTLAPKTGNMIETMTKDGDCPWETYYRQMRKVGARKWPPTHVGGYPWWIQGAEGSPKQLHCVAGFQSEDKADLIWGDGGRANLFLDKKSARFRLSVQCY